MTEQQVYRLKNIILYILKDFSGGVDYIKLYKILYFANREHLAKVGIPMIHDNFKAWHMGPVPSFVGTVVKTFEENLPLKRDMKPFDGAIRVRRNKRVMGIEAPDTTCISPFTIRSLDRFISKYKFYNSKQLSKDSHDLAWNEAYYKRGGRTTGHATIDPIMMARADNASEDIIQLLYNFYSESPLFYNFDCRDGKVDIYEDVAIKLQVLTELSEGWDGEDAYAIEHATVLNCRTLLSAVSARIENLVSLYPTPCGTICLDWLKHGAKVSTEISDTHIAFYYKSADKTEIYDSPTYSFGEEALDNIYSYLSKLV